MTDSDVHQTVLITGASSGIGLACVEAVAERCADVVATVRKNDDASMVRERQRRLRHPVRTALLDLGNDDQIRSVIDEHQPDVVVNNAGDALLGPVTDADVDRVTAQFRQHVIGPMQVTSAALPHMRRKGRGRIVNVSSALARTAVPMTGWYAAAKAAQAMVTAALRAEVAEEGIDVVLVELGAVDTPAWDAATDPEGPAGEEWARATRLVRPFFSDAATAAATIADAVCDPNPRNLYRVGFGTELLALSGRVPAAVRDRMLRHMFT
ncbi:MAG: SDR family NAD(P)-dependent oxidoreductase [Acidimicrobiales bacterium]|nr:SDR family NAD(P)-dependent oxidoreductase [Acidimicrobiales bacterium]